MNFVGIDLTMLDRWHEQQQTNSFNGRDEYGASKTNFQHLATILSDSTSGVTEIIWASPAKSGFWPLSWILQRLGTWWQSGFGPSRTLGPLRCGGVRYATGFHSKFRWLVVSVSPPPPSLSICFVFVLEIGNRVETPY
ncbi:hypothetical protein TNCV_3585141 [Trichonephila clavipes]|nr:hypothetical protein TNCV_3585141 [Trichonephila clavipes]